MSRANAWSNMKANLAKPIYDPDEGLYLAPDFQARLARQLEQVRASAAYPWPTWRRTETGRDRAEVLTTDRRMETRR